jgi:hypothetical protein
MAPRLGIAFTVREKFGWALAALQRVYRFGEVPFTLYFVDCGYPEAIRTEINRFLADKDNVVRLRTPGFVWPSVALNLIVPRLQEEYLCVIQNDVLIQSGYFGELLATFEEHRCDMVQPETFELQDGAYRPHRHEYTDCGIFKVDGRWYVHVSIEGRSKPLPPIRRIQHFEMHTLMFSKRAVQRIHPFPAINTREHIDLAMRAYHDGLTAFINERAKASYVLPPLQASDAAYFNYRWDVTAARAAHQQVAERWHIANMPNAMQFIAGHRKFLLPERLKHGPAVCEVDTFE